MGRHWGFRYERARRAQPAWQWVDPPSRRRQRRCVHDFSNFSAIEKYNTADAYVIGVGHLSDRIKGGPPIKGKWPHGDRALTFNERKELQRRLTRAGFDTQKIDGKIGPLTINAVRAFQKARGLTPDGYASLALLKQLRKN